MMAGQIATTVLALACLAWMVAIANGWPRPLWHAFSRNETVRLLVFVAWAVLVILLYEVSVGQPLREMTVDAAVRRAVNAGAAPFPQKSLP